MSDRGVLIRPARPRDARSYLADVYVLPEYRGRGLGEELVREMVENGDLGDVRWFLHTEDAHALYRKFGFEEEGRLVRQSRKSYGYEDELIMSKFLFDPAE